MTPRPVEAVAQLRRMFADHTLTAPERDTLIASAREARPTLSMAELLSQDSLALVVEPKAEAHGATGGAAGDFDIGRIARECQVAGAHAMSVVTDGICESGSVAHLAAARAGCELPLIARDFIVDVRQVYVLRAAGADALLIPMFAHRSSDDDSDSRDAEFGSETLAGIIQAAHELSMEAVLSVRTEDELACALDQEADALNIDNRSDDGSVDVERTFDLLAQVPVGWPVMSESIAATSEVARLHRAGVDALLLDEGHLDTGLTNALAVYTDLTLDR